MIRVDPRSLRPGDYVTIHIGRLTVTGWVHWAGPTGGVVALELERNRDGLVTRVHWLQLTPNAIVLVGKAPARIDDVA